MSKSIVAATRFHRSPKAGTATTEVIPKTLRLAPEYEAGLALLKGVLGMPVNKMVNEAVGEYIRKRTAEVEADLTGVLAQVKAYRRADPHFKKALSTFVDAEARHGGKDPVEGGVVAAPSGAARRKAKARSAQSMIRDMPNTGS